jgi:hypothetical protein
VALRRYLLKCKALLALRRGVEARAFADATLKRVPFFKGA